MSKDGALGSSNILELGDEREVAFRPGTIIVHAGHCVNYVGIVVDNKFAHMLSTEDMARFKTSPKTCFIFAVIGCLPSATRNVNLACLKVDNLFDLVAGIVDYAEDLFFDEEFSLHVAQLNCRRAMRRELFGFDDEQIRVLATIKLAQCGMNDRKMPRWLRNCVRNGDAWAMHRHLTNFDLFAERRDRRPKGKKKNKGKKKS